MIGRLVILYLTCRVLALVPVHGWTGELSMLAAVVVASWLFDVAMRARHE